MTGDVIDLYRGIWEDRNKTLHGDNRRDHLIYLRSVIQEQVRLLYKNSPKLHKRFTKIQKITLEERLSQSTVHLIHWLNQIKHQKTISERLFQISGNSQQSIRRS